MARIIAPPLDDPFPREIPLIERGGDVRAFWGIAFNLMVAVLATRPWAQSTPYGGATPQEVVAGIQEAAKAGDFAAASPFIFPTGRQMLATAIIQPLLMWVRMSNPDDPMPGSATPPKAKLDAKRKTYRAVVDGLTQALEPLGLDSVIGKPPMGAATQQAMDTALAKADTVLLMKSLLATLNTLGPLMAMPRDAIPSLPPIGAVTGYKISGDRAVAKEGKEGPPRVPTFQGKE